MKTAEEMKEFKGTKGEWEIREDVPYSSSGYVIFRGRGDQNKTICRMPYGNMCPPILDDGHYENKANAQLIAAAPDLLEALQELVLQVKTYSKGYSDTTEYFKSEIKQAEKAINKALGL